MTLPSSLLSAPLANAPVSLGVWGPHTGPEGAAPADLLLALASAGYVGSELGPTGYLGDPGATADAFVAAGLHPAGVYVGVPLGRGRLDGDARDGLVAACRTLVAARDAAAAHVPSPGQTLPVPPIVLADDGDPCLADAPRDHSAGAGCAGGLGDAEWASAVAVLREASRVVADHGLTGSFHEHLATWVEGAWEVDRLLQDTDLQVTLDTGHLLLAGADPVECLRAWRGRVDHVHLKDVKPSVPVEALAVGATRIRAWWGRACVPLGEGSVDLAGVLRELSAQDYRGWLVVEQDHEPVAGERLVHLEHQQRDNRVLLESLLASAEVPATG